MMFFDTHAHYDDEQFDADRKEVLGSLKEHGVGAIVNAAQDVLSWKKIRALTVKYPFIYGSAGLHPFAAAELTDETLGRLREILKEDKFVAVGEIGLDNHMDNPNQGVQRESFIRQLLLAKELNLPVIIHSRDAQDDTMKILKKYAEGIGGVLHCYAYSASDALKYAEMGFFIGIGGAVTFKKAANLREVVSKVPLENLVLETDCPYLSPVPVRGTRNASFNLIYVASKIADIKGIQCEEVAERTYENAKRLYRL